MFFVKYSVNLTTNGKVITESIVPAVKISEARSGSFPHFMHKRVHIAAGGAAAATSTVIFTFSGIGRNKNITESIKGSKINFMKHIR